jgi:hypothetical protein
MNEPPRPFPVLLSRGVEGCPKFVRMDALNEEWARMNHGHSLERLAQLGGLDPTEIAANLQLRPWREMDLNEAVTIISEVAL